jgi:magnesium transporter
VAIYQNALLVRMPVAVAQRKSVGLTIVLVNRTIITIRQDDIPSLDKAIDRLRNTSIQVPHPAMLLFELVDKIVDDDTNDALAIRRRVDDLERKLDEPEAEFDLDMVSDCRRDAVSLEAVMEDQRSCLGGLQTSSLDALRAGEFQAYLRDVISHLDHNILVAGRAEDRLDALQQHSLLKLQYQQNKRLQLLTVVSAIFLPLSLITGIYGMNFRHMPELSWRFGYGLVLLVMLSIAVALLYVLHRRHWFR